MKKSNHSVYLIINDAGTSERFNSSNNSINLKKEHLILGDNITVLEESILSIIKIIDISEIIIVYNKDFYEETKRILLNNKIIKNYNIVFVEGSKEKISGTYQALKYLKNKANDDDIVITHDAARPFTDAFLLKDLYKNVISNDASVPFLNINDSLRIFTNNLLKYINRDSVVRIITPQFYKFKTIFFSFTNNFDKKATDESELVIKNNNFKIKMIKSYKENIKLTTKRDYEILKIDYKLLKDKL